MDEVLRTRIVRARELLGTARHAAMATVNEDGSPHNTPFFYAMDESRRHVYWASSPQALHSRNLTRSGQAFIVLYEANKGGGLYLEARKARELAGDELVRGLAVWGAKRTSAGRPAMAPADFSGESPQRLYGADIARLWVNYSERDAAGNVVRDYRHEIDREELIEKVRAAQAVKGTSGRIE